MNKCCQYVSIVWFSVYKNVSKCMFGRNTLYVNVHEYSWDHVGLHCLNKQKQIIVYSHSNSQLGAIWSELHYDIFLCLKYSPLSVCNRKMCSVWTECMAQRIKSSCLSSPLLCYLIWSYDSQRKISFKNILFAALNGRTKNIILGIDW